MPHWHRSHGQATKAADTGPSLPMPDETSTELRFLEPDAFELRRHGTRLQFRDTGSEWLDVALVRLFPLRDPDRWVSLIDAEGREVGIIRDTAALPRGARGLVRDEFHRRYIVPEIQRILSTRRRGDAMEWVVETDRGTRTFLTRHLRDQLRNPSPTRLSLIDVEGNRYHITDVAALDPESRRRLESHL